MRTRTVAVGPVGVGGANPIRIQSMTTTPTRDVSATAAQIERLVDAGCEIVRIATPSRLDAEALGDIRSALDRRRLRVPLVADVHFAPNAALAALEHADKVRINPGNLADRKRFEVRTYTDAEYDRELERVGERFRPIVARAKALGRALRIGTNHGSLSDRIVNRYGDSPLGMVESALEFLDVCEAEGFRDVVFSMKSSNPLVMIDAYRLLAERLGERCGEAGAYPLHLGVTEAGSGRDGRIKSAIGIGALLEEGLGDTIRVSLTEDPVREIPVAGALARRGRRPIDALRTPLAASRHAAVRETTRVELELGPLPQRVSDAAVRIDRAVRDAAPLACEGLLVDAPDGHDAERLAALIDALARCGVAAPLRVRLDALCARAIGAGVANAIVRVTARHAPVEVAEAAERCRAHGVSIEWQLSGRLDALPALVDRVLAVDARRALPVSVETDDFVVGHRAVVQLLADAGRSARLALRLRVDPRANEDHALVDVARQLGAVLTDGHGACVSLGAELDPADALDVAYRILQAARVRTTRAEFISCPSCARTLFDLEDVTGRIQARTAHLQDVKIAVMGCIVNGPGEMADADFGYVGSGPDAIDLYVGRHVAESRVPAGDAVDRLVDLIRKHDRWTDPPPPEPMAEAQSSTTLGSPTCRDTSDANTNRPAP